MRLAVPLLLSAALLASACSDELKSPLVPQTRVDNTEYDTGPMGTTEQYWRSTNELWVYDNTTELGFNHHLPKHELYQTGINQIRWGSARMMRFDLDWSRVDTTGYGGYPATNCASCMPLHNYLDNFRDNVERALNTSVVPVVVVHGTPGVHQHYNSENNWQGATDAQLAVTRQEFTRFVSDMVQLMPGVTFWQILNEVDAGHHGVPALGGGAFYHAGGGLFTFNRNAQGQNYALLMQSVYPAIKQANPNAWVVMSALTGTPYMDASSNPVTNEGWDFLHGFYQGGGRNYVDMMAINAYGLPTNDPLGFTAKGTQILSVMSQYGDAKRPLWLTEFGRGAGMYIRANGAPMTNAGPTFDSDQSAFYADALYHLQYGHMFQKAMAYNVSASDLEAPPSTVPLPTDGSCGNYLLGGPKQNCEPNDYGTGLMRTDLVTPRPAYNVIAGHGINHNWLFNGSGYGDITVLAGSRNPVGYSYTRNGSYVTVHSVTLNKLYPTKIMWEPLGHPDPENPCYPQLSC